MTDPLRDLLQALEPSSPASADPDAAARLADRIPGLAAHRQRRRVQRRVRAAGAALLFLVAGLPLFFAAPERDETHARRTLDLSERTRVTAERMHVLLANRRSGSTPESGFTSAARRQLARLAPPPRNGAVH